MRQAVWVTFAVTSVVDVSISSLVLYVAVTQHIAIPWDLLWHTPVDMALGLIGYRLMFCNPHGYEICHRTSAR